MSELYPVNGCKIYIGGALAPSAEDLNEASFAGQSWIEIDGWETMGPMGDAAALITSPIINRSRDAKMKGTANAGSMQNNFGVIAADPGQIALIAAGQASNHNNYAFRVDLNDKPASGPAPAPSKRYFVGLVMGTPEQGGNANTTRLLQATIEINSNIVRIPATAGT